MIIDIVLSLLFVFAAYMGFHGGFMRSLVKFASTSIAIIVAISASSPAAVAFQNKWNWGDKVGGVFVLTLILAVALFILIKIAAFFVSKFIATWKAKSPLTDRVDKIAGIFFGLATCFLNICFVFWAIRFLAQLGPMAKAVDWLFNSSHIGKGIYKVSGEIIKPLIKSIENAIK